MDRVLADLHMHSRVSDGSDTPAELVRIVKDRGIRIFSLTDHDSISGWNAVRESLPEELIFVPGIEFSCVTEVAKCHILGYGCDPENRLLGDTIAVGRAIRAEKNLGRLKYLKEQWGITFEPEELMQFFALENGGKPHLAQMLIRKGYGNSITDVIRTYLNPYRGGRDRIDAKMAVDAILAAGGIPVWAHPLGGEGEKRLPPEKVEAQLSVLRGLGIRGLECFYSRYTDAETEQLLAYAETYGLLISGGSDYHGTVKTVEPGCLNAEGMEIPADRLTILKELGIGSKADR